MVKINFELTDMFKVHWKNVRCLAICRDGSVVTAGDDDEESANTSKLSIINEKTTIIMVGHKSKVSCVCVLYPDEAFGRGGLIVSGSDDHTVCIYQYREAEPCIKIEAHRGKVTCVARSNFSKTDFFSGSLDHGVKLWKIVGEKITGCVVYTGHKDRVSAITDLLSGTVVSAAGSIILLHQREGPCMKKIVDQGAIVKGLCCFGNWDFWSCNNLGVIRKWISAGNCVGDLSGSDDPLWGLTSLPELNLAVSYGSDAMVRVWSRTNEEQTFKFPCHSVNCAEIYVNQESRAAIVTGASDGKLRLFADFPDFQEEEPRDRFEEDIKYTELIVEAGLNVSDL